MLLSPYFKAIYGGVSAAIASLYTITAVSDHVTLHGWIGVIGAGLGTAAIVFGVPNTPKAEPPPGP